MMTDPLVIFVIYRNPADHPGKYVVRRWVVNDQGIRMGRVVAIRDSLQRARAAVPDRLACLAPSQDDDPVIVETWL